jgi:hypothetical protein
MSTTKRSTPFQPTDCVTYGLEITGYDMKKAVTCVQCLFCAYEGRIGRSDDDSARKRARTNKIKLFSHPYRPENFRRHMEGQHAEQWSNYQSLSRSLKKEYFNEKAKAASIVKFASKDSDVLEITIARNIVDELIGKLYFHPEEDADDGDEAPMSKANAMKLFKLKEDDDTAPVYKVCIKNTLRFWLAIDQTSSGLSFQQTAEVMEQY